MNRTRLGWCVGVALILIAAGCKPRIRPPLDAASAPPGTGWHCYKHEAAGTVALGICYRDGAKCAAEGANDGGSVCAPQAEAFCTDLRPGSDTHDMRCVATMADCEEIARNFAGMGPSQCGTVP